MAISVMLHISDNDDEDIFLDDIQNDSIQDWLQTMRVRGGILCDTYHGTTPYIPFDEVKSFWFHDEDFVEESAVPVLVY